MAFANDLLVRILGDTKGLERSFAQANRATSQFGRQVEGVGTKADKSLKSLRGFATGATAGFAGGLVASEILRQSRAAIDAASSLQEQISASNVVFEESASVVQEWSKTTAASIGVARDEALLAANTFGSIFDAAGKSSSEAARLSQAVVQLGGDLASFADTSVEDALNALRSGLSGEIEPLRRYRVFLTEAAVAQEAMAQTGKRSAAQLTQGEKILARWNLILQGTEKAQGDAARTADSYANQTRRLSAELRNTQAVIGGLLLPVATELVGVLNDGAVATDSLVQALGRLANAEIPVVDIPVNFTFPGTSVDVRGALKEFALQINPVTGPVRRVKQVVDLIRGDTEKVIDDAAGDYRKLVESIPKKFSDQIQSGAFRDPESAKVGIGDAIRSFVNAATKSANDAVKEGQRRIDAEAAKQRRSDFFDRFIAGLELGVDKASLNRTLKDDLSALEALKAGLQRQIKAGEDVVAAQAQLVQVERTIAETSAQITQNRRDADTARRQREQFRSLGLSETGDEIIPGIQNLQQRINGALQRIQSGQLDVSGKLVERLKLARSTIRKHGKELTDETRSVINDLLKSLTGATKGPLTKTSSLNASKLLEGLGLGRDMEKELRARLSSFNSAGLALAGGGARPTGQFVGGPPVVESHVTVELDGEAVSRSVTRTQQKQRRRNTKQKRGPNSGV